MADEDDPGQEVDPADVVDPSQYIVLERKVYEAEREDRAGARRLLAIAMLLLAFALIINAGFGIYDRREESNNEKERVNRSERLVDKVDGVAGDLEDLTEVVAAVRRATSPEAQARQAEVLQGAITEIDCNSRDALQVLGDALAEAGTAARITIRCAG